jgi:hypothetical protein
MSKRESLSLLQLENYITLYRVKYYALWDLQVLVKLQSVHLLQSKIKFCLTV